MATTVTILVTDQIAAASQNLKLVNRLSDVTWVNASSEPFQVVFTEFEPPNGPRQTNIPARGPFSQTISVDGRGQVTDTIRADTADGRYFYEIHRNGGPLQWLNPIGPPPDDFGGVEVHGPPPRTTSGSGSGSD